MTFKTQTSWIGLSKKWGAMSKKYFDNSVFVQKTCLYIMFFPMMKWLPYCPSLKIVRNMGASLPGRNPIARNVDHKQKIN